MKSHNGRIGTSTEYTEYQIEHGPHAGQTIIVQFNGTHWVVYHNWPGQNGRVKTIDGTTDPELARRMARAIAIDLEHE